MDLDVCQDRELLVQELIACGAVSVQFREDWEAAAGKGLGGVLVGEWISAIGDEWQKRLKMQATVLMGSAIKNDGGSVMLLRWTRWLALVKQRWMCNWQSYRDECAAGAEKN